MDVDKLHEEYVREIRNVGESLIKNAESIVGTEKNLKSIYISFDIETLVMYDTANRPCFSEFLDGAPEIEVRKTYFPERSVDED